jgi:hypothetical protein
MDYVMAAPVYEGAEQPAIAEMRQAGFHPPGIEGRELRVRHLA